MTREPPRLWPLLAVAGVIGVVAWGALTYPAVRWKIEEPIDVAVSTGKPPAPLASAQPEAVVPCAVACWREDRLVVCTADPGLPPPSGQKVTYTAEWLPASLCGAP